MSLLDIEEDNLTAEDEGKQNFVVPKVFFPDKDEISLPKAFGISIGIHAVAIVVFTLLFYIFALLGIINILFPSPERKTEDISFVLVEKEQPPINKNTPYRSDRNSRAGGKHDPTKKVSLPTGSGGQKAKSPSPKPGSPKSQSKPTVKQQPQQVANAGSSTQPAKTPDKKQPPSARPSVRPSFTPKATDKPTSNFQVPVPTGGTASGKYSTGPVSGSGKTASQAVSTAKATGPTPTLAPTGGNGGSGNGAKLAGKGGYGGSGGYNPGPGGDPNGTPGIDAIKEPDFGPYMRELQRRIKMNWDPPKGDESKRVILLFKIAKDGRLLSCSVHKSSGLPNADKAAIQAVQLSAPFKPLPPNYRGSSIDIQFTFDYNVFGATSYR